MNSIITISREVGSGGHAIGEMVSKILDIPFIDRDFVQKAAEATGLPTATIEKKGEFISPLNKYMSGSWYSGLYLGDDQDRLFTAQKDIILDIAKKGPCVIVGRCADYILEAAKIPALNVFIHADMDYRRANCEERYHKEGANIDKLLMKMDKGRRFYYRYYTDREWGDLQNYDLVLRSSSLGPELCARIIAEVAQKRG